MQCSTVKCSTVKFSKSLEDFRTVQYHTDCMVQYSIVLHSVGEVHHRVVLYCRSSTHCSAVHVQCSIVVYSGEYSGVQ